MAYSAIPMPNGLKKDELLRILQTEEYGYLPEVPDSISVREISKDIHFASGRAEIITLELTASLRGRSFAFPFTYTKLTKKVNTPCVIYMNFKDNVPHKYLPSEELCDRGYSILSFCYTDVTSDNGDFTNGLAGVVYPDGKRGPADCGKIGLWAWAAMRVMDYALTLPEIDHKKISVAGHSRLGKTALLTGALDERFYCAYSNDSGCSGASIARGNRGETVTKIIRAFPFWFCENYFKYSNNEDAMPFDQHFLIAANAPHRVYVASAAEDLWADPDNEYKGCLLAASYYRDSGLPVSLSEEMPSPGERLHGGYIGYHIREGTHFISREDWNIFFDYLNASYSNN